GELAAEKGEEGAAVDLDLGAVAGRAREEPFREAAVAVDEMPRAGKARVGVRREDSSERRAHALAADVARAARVRARGALEDAVVRHERHQAIEVVAVPAGLEERVQVFGGHRS